MKYIGMKIIVWMRVIRPIVYQILARSHPSSVGTHTRTQLFKKYKNYHIHSHVGAMGASYVILEL